MKKFIAIAVMLLTLSSSYAKFGGFGPGSFSQPQSNPLHPIWNTHSSDADSIKTVAIAETSVKTVQVDYTNRIIFFMVIILIIVGIILIMVRRFSTESYFEE